MTETTVEKEICNACGVDIRPQADYCYNCGGAVSDSAAANKTSSASANETARSALIEPASNEEKPEIIKTPTTEKTKIAATKIEKNQAVSEQTKLKSAASLRRKSKTFERKTVEVIWEEHDDAPNGWFISVAVLLALLAIGILFLAAYLK